MPRGRVNSEKPVKNLFGAGEKIRAAELRSGGESLRIAGLGGEFAEGRDGQFDREPERLERRVDEYEDDRRYRGGGIREYASLEASLGQAVVESAGRGLQVM